jgi:hypothetical protein
LWPYGSGRPTQKQLQRILREVYRKHPLNRCE